MITGTLREELVKSRQNQTVDLGQKSDVLRPFISTEVTYRAFSKPLFVHGIGMYTAFLNFVA